LFGSINHRSEFLCGPTVPESSFVRRNLHCDGKEAFVVALNV